MSLSTYSTQGPSPLEVGELFFELAEAFAVGELAAQLSANPQLVEQGKKLQVDSTELLTQLAARLGIVLEDVEAGPETGFMAGLAKLGARALKWLKGTSKAIAGGAARHANKLAVLGGVAAAGITVYDWVTGEEQTRRAAIAAKKAATLELIKKMPASQVSRAFDRMAAGLDADSSQGLRWWQWGLVGLGVYAGYRVLSTRSDSAQPAMKPARLSRTS